MQVKQLELGCVTFMYYIQLLNQKYNQHLIKQIVNIVFSSHLSIII